MPPVSDATETLHAGKFVRLVRRGRWEFVQRTNPGGVVGIVAMTNESELVLVEQYREAAGCRCIELPAGLIGDDDADEDARAAAARELEEETGFRAQSVEMLVSGPASSGLADVVTHLVRASGLTRVSPGGGIDGEDIEVHVVPVGTVEAFLHEKIAAGRKVDMRVWAGLWFASRPRAAAP
jgi:ADP-ribose pyrophosphatase